VRRVNVLLEVVTFRSGPSMLCVVKGISMSNVIGLSAAAAENARCESPPRTTPHPSNTDPLVRPSASPHCLWRRPLCLYASTRLSLKPRLVVPRQAQCPVPWQQQLGLVAFTCCTRCGWSR